MRFGVFFSFLIISFAFAPASFASWWNPFPSKDKPFNKVESIQYSRKDVFDIDSQIIRTEFDKKIDELIFDQLGEHYRRANSHDLYPMELPKKLAKKLDYQDQIAMMEFYNYCRKDLEKLSGGSKFLKAYAYNYDGDAAKTKDYAVIVFDVKKKQIYLAIINDEKTLYLEKFEASHLEPINNGLFPTEVVYEDDKTKFVTNPALRVVAFEGDSYILYFDAKEKDWEELYLQ